MANYSIVEEPRARKPRSNHPCHPHNLQKTDMRQVYKDMLWRCDLCRVEFNSRLSLTSSNAKEADPTFAFHCDLCSFDVCSLCFKGHLHPFHHHRLKKAQVSLIYPQTDGQWRCDACQKVFTKVTAPMSYHCPQCEVDICDKCFTGSWKTVLHNSYHPLKPVDPRLSYRKYINWYCDVCDREFTSKDSETFFNCFVCQYDVCSDCFHGEKHHLHQHPLCLVNKDMHGTAVCSNCQKFIVESQYRKCREPTCSFSLCGLCYLSPPKYHPYHRDHPLTLCDAEVVYPESGGLWHCDYCTNTNPLKQQTPLPASRPMYHCDVCEYDLCVSCYRRGLVQNQPQASVASYPTPYSAQRTSSSGYYMDTRQDTDPPRYYQMEAHKPPALSSISRPLSGMTGSLGQSASNYHWTTTNFSPSRPVMNGSYGNASQLRGQSLSSLSTFAGKQPKSAPSSVESYSSGEVGKRPHLTEHSTVYGAAVSSIGKACRLCMRYKATKYFCHGKSVMTCTAEPLVCERCAGDVIVGGKPCPSCERIPDGVSDVPF